MTDSPNDQVPPASQSASYGSAAPYSATPAAGATGDKKTLSIISMIAGIVGLLGSFTGFGLIASVAAVILGHLGQRREKVAGRGFWLTGLITGYVGIAIALIVIVLAIIGFAILANDPTFQQQLNQ